MLKHWRGQNNDKDLFKVYDNITHALVKYDAAKNKTEKKVSKKVSKKLLKELTEWLNKP